ncbi:hypothetical protein NP493_471g02019 [Ridgeia piscesae]|uniref:Uncharacterized protein n=1 Tax=Ridgeia piscesae TaxID=27915 RepID=A0AAD9NT80_RIDPI|nr:hypothetical protein NP493_471g02019 [Ridgeia piscesae]
MQQPVELSRLDAIRCLLMPIRSLQTYSAVCLFVVIRRHRYVSTIRLYTLTTGKRKEKARIADPEQQQQQQQQQQQKQQKDQTALTEISQTTPVTDKNISCVVSVVTTSGVVVSGVVVVVSGVASSSSTTITTIAVAIGI